MTQKLLTTGVCAGSCGSISSWSLLSEMFKAYAEAAAGLCENRHTACFYYEGDEGIKAWKHFRGS